LIREIKPDWLIRQAQDLGGFTSGPGQPRNSDLRRAVSSAYYALFHQISDGVICSVFPRSARMNQLQLRRHITHASVKRVSSWISGDQPSSHLVDLVKELRSDHLVTQVAQSFSHLLQQRELADYDHLADFRKEVVVVDVVRARQATQVVTENFHLQQFQEFSGLIWLTTSLSR
jgi:hypothetical protein